MGSEAMGRTRASAPLVIAISGVDGSGKTSVIERLRATLAEHGLVSRYVWLRYNHYLTKFLLAFCRFSGLTRYQHFGETRVVYHDFHRNRLVAWAFVILTWIDTWLVSLLLVRVPARLSRKAIICDRWIYDIMVDLEVDTGLDFSDGSRLNRWFKRILPPYVHCFVIDRDLGAVRRTRQESQRDDNFPVRHQLFVRHARDPRLLRVDNNGAIEDSVRQILVRLGIETDNEKTGSR